jgi:ubiquinone/menaquinone biosynthesis C-methylase UbiE
MVMEQRSGIPVGVVLHAATGYDVLVWLVTLGRDGRFRDEVVRNARLAVGESVLDVGCGTGNLAIAAKERVGPAGSVHGIDAAPEMIARASKKASQRGMQVNFQLGIAQELPFADAQFDVVLSTLMLHHLPHRGRPLLMREIRRVLKPRGRVLVVDFAELPRARKSFVGRFHRHGHVKLEDMQALLSEAGLHTAASGPIGFGNMQFVLAQAGMLRSAAQRTVSPANIPSP